MAIEGAFDERVSRLAQHRPFDHDGAGLEESLRGLVLGAATANDGKFSSLVECRDALRTLWDLDFEIDEIRRAVEGLASDGMATFSGGGFAVAEAVLDDLERTAQATAANEVEAFRDWEASVAALG